jgi:hypothetical protein
VITHDSSHHPVRLAAYRACRSNSAPKYLRDALLKPLADLMDAARRYAGTWGAPDYFCAAVNQVTTWTTR